MIQTGIQQSEIAYRVRGSDKAPLDVDGELTTLSGKRQAIALLEGAENPDPLLYEVQFTYAPGAIIEGQPTAQYSDACPLAVINVAPENVVLTEAVTSVNITVFSTDPWMVAQVPPQITVSRFDGPEGTTVVTLTRTGVLGDGVLLIRNLDIAQSYPVGIRNLESTGWILEDGTWHMYKLWLNNGIWNY